MARTARRTLTPDEDARSLAGRLAHEYASMVARICWNYLHSTADAEDVFQQIMLRVLTGNVRFASPEHERAWVVRSAINACKNILASSAWRTTVELDEASEVEDPQAQVDVTGMALAEALEKLPTSYRIAIYLHYYEGFAIAEIAEATGDTVAAVTKRLSRARAMLKDELEDQHE